MDAELRFHLDMETQKNLAQGLSPEDARRRAAITLGGLERFKEEGRDSRGLPPLENLARDVRYGFRSLRRAPGFAAAVVVTLALGIGANTAIFSVVNSILLRPLPYGGHGEMVALHARAPGIGVADAYFSPTEVRDLREQAKTLDGVAEFHQMGFTLLGGQEPQRVRTGVVSANYFDVFGVRPLLGRDFREDDDRPGADPVLLLSYDFWMSSLGGDPGVVGRKFEMNDRVHTVIGVLPRLPAYPAQVDVFMPTSACPFRSRAATIQKRDARMVNLFARVSPGTGVAKARAELGTIVGRLASEHPAEYPANTQYRFDVVPAQEEMVGGARPTFLVLLATVGIVLLTACFNAASLIIARLLARDKELAVRMALGASPWRIALQLLTEATLLSLMAGALGLLLARGSLGLLTTFAARFTPRAREVTMDGTVLGFTVLASLVTGLLAGAIPGLPPLRRLAQALQQGGRSTGAGGRLRGVLVAAELALSFVLLIGAALTLRSFGKLVSVNLGFQTENVLTAELQLDFSRYLTPDHKTDSHRLVDGFYATLEERVRAIPGVLHVGAGWSVPLDTRFDTNNSYLIADAGGPQGPPLHAELFAASPDYFQAIGVPLLRGRAFLPTDREKDAGVVIVSDSLARSRFGGGDPLGRRVSIDNGKTWRTIVGVVGDVRSNAIDKVPSDAMYLPFYEVPGVTPSYFVRSVGSPRLLEREFKKAVHATDGQTPVANVRTLAEVRSESLAPSRLTAALLGIFAFIAISIAGAGLSGLMAFQVSQRTQEIGIRMALGADRRSVLTLVLGEGLRSVCIGLGLGLLAALAGSRLIAGLLFGISPTDAACYIGCALVLLATGLLACLPSARRATSVDPQLALRAL
jgi:predicted permease